MSEESYVTDVDVYALTDFSPENLTRELARCTRVAMEESQGSPKRRRLNGTQAEREIITLAIQHINFVSKIDTHDVDYRNLFFSRIDKVTDHIDVPVGVEFRIEGEDPENTLRISSVGENADPLFNFNLDSSKITSILRRDIAWASSIVLLKANKPTEEASRFDCICTLHFNLRLLTLSLSLKLVALSMEEWSLYSIKLAGESWWQLLARAFPNGAPVVEGASTVTPRDFYNSCHAPDKRETVLDEVQHKILSCELLPYQRRTVRWMLKREGIDLERSKGLLATEKVEKELPPTFFKATDKEGKTCYVSHILGVVSNNLKALQRKIEMPKGGILAEEMGLGKTVELIALMALNPMPETPEGDIYNISSTLIITPPSILEQWKTEITKHAPIVKVFHYQGMKFYKDLSTSDLVQNFRENDVILTTYSVLSSELHYLTSRNRRMRAKKKYEARKSPLAEVNWWRVCVDEAQMIDGGFSNAAVVARTIPRIHAWAVTGTPIRKDINDLHGLLRFLKYEPFGDRSPSLFTRLTRFNHSAFKAVFRSITLRHTKDMVGDEIHLPSQKRVVVTVPFSAVEEQNYSHLFQQMCSDCGITGSGARGELEVEMLDKMRVWLTRLRQTCLHPQAGERNRKVFGSHKGPLRTVNEVLDVMIDTHSLSIRTDERALFESMIRRGQIHEIQGKYQVALGIWMEVLMEVQKIVRECRDVLEVEAKGITKTARTTEAVEMNGVNSMDWDLGEDISDDDREGYINTRNDAGRIGTLKNRLRNFLDLEHRCFFWVGTAWYQLRHHMEKNDPKREELVDFNKREGEYYSAAKTVRKEIMQETRGRALKLIKGLRNRATKQEFVNIPDIAESNLNCGIETHGIFIDIVDLTNTLNTQAKTLDIWREQLIQLLTKPIIDEDNVDQEDKGDEFEVSVSEQELSERLMTAIRALIADREEVLTGVVNALVKHDIQTDLSRDGTHQELLKKMMKERDMLRPDPVLKCLKFQMSELRNRVAGFKMWDGSSRLKMQKELVETELKKLQGIMTIQGKVNIEITREIEFFRNVTNARKDFYRQVQDISDTVQQFDPEVFFGKNINIDNTLFEMILKDEKELKEKVTRAKSKLRYLVHLKGQGVDESPECLVCKDTYEIGILTSCGHSYCKECMVSWYKHSRKCPACTANLSLKDMYQISYKPKEATMQEERTSSASCVTGQFSQGIYSNMDNSIMKEIKRVEIKQYFGSKIDMIVRHLLWLQKNEPGFKAVIFSQWSDFLEFMKTVLAQSKVGFATLEKKDGIEKFKNDPECHCFFLHAKSQSAGLSLINATHVFLCEPLINISLELQAISRVHRIGQTRPTTVWLYVVNGTVEQSVLELSTRRRMALMEKSQDEEDRKPEGQMSFSRESSDDESRVSSQNFASPLRMPADRKLDAANSVELQKGIVKLVEKSIGGGEIVNNDDLWECLFGMSGSSLHTKEVGDDVRREMLAGAAEKRIALGVGILRSSRDT